MQLLNSIRSAAMAFVNLYQSPALPKRLTEEELYGPDPYDINFCYPLPSVTLLASDRVRLSPFVPRLHASAFWEEFGPDTAAHTRLVINDWPTQADMLLSIENTRQDAGSVLFAVLAETEGGTKIAGLIGLQDTSSGLLSTMLSSLTTLPWARGTHVTTHAVGLLLKYVLEPPSRGGIGLRRVYYRALPENFASLAVARRFYFRDEGLIRWARIVREGKEGLKPREGDPMPNKNSRHAFQLSLCCDDWEERAKERTDELMSRK